MEDFTISAPVQAPFSDSNGLIRPFGKTLRVGIASADAPFGKTSGVRRASWRGLFGKTSGLGIADWEAPFGKTSSADSARLQGPFGKTLSLLIWAVLGLVLSASSCEPDDPPVPEPPDPIDSTAVLTYAGLPGLQDKVFRPTCANSGCHDGTFEPDFRTLGSTYATLVNQSVIKNDAAGSYRFRVVPGDTAASQLLVRLQRDIDGNSGIMPLVVEPSSDYPQRRATYIAWVRRWIQEGAKRSE